MKQMIRFAPIAIAAAVALDQPDGLQSLILITPGLRYRIDLSLLTKAKVFLSLLAGGADPL